MEIDQRLFEEIKHLRKTTIFMPDGSVMPVLNEKRNICNMHILLANEVCKCVPKAEDKRRMLALIEEAYDMGKRMDKGLMFYRTEMGINKSQGRELEKKAADGIKGSEEDVTP